MSAIIEVRNLSVGWSDDAVLLEGARFDVERGTVFAILGTSGSGKSTLIRYLAGLDTPLGGTIEIDGAPPDLDGTFPRFGVMFQQGALIGSLNVVENVALPLSTWTRIPEHAILRIALAKLALVGLDGASTKMPSELSGGMLKRAAIARALALESPLLFLDEPTAGLDPVTAGGIDELIATLQRVMDVTVVLVTHDIGTVFAIADDCILLDRTAKAIIAEGPPSALAQSSDARVRAFFERSRRVFS
jgi:phospholipid/cholesterol/gamma-HCH transport system ATP-binding protein